MAKTKRRTIGESPLDTVLAVRRAKEHSSEPTATDSKTAPKERLTIHVPTDLVERLRDAVYWTPGLTMAGLAEDALAKALEAMEKRNGGPFSKRAGKLKLGRPVK
jgi:hypothetical protein